MPQRTKFHIQYWDHFESTDQTCANVKCSAFKFPIFRKNKCGKKMKTYQRRPAGRSRRKIEWQPWVRLACTVPVPPPYGQGHKEGTDRGFTIPRVRGGACRSSLLRDPCEKSHPIACDGRKKRGKTEIQHKTWPHRESYSGRRLQEDVPCTDYTNRAWVITIRSFENK